MKFERALVVEDDAHMRRLIVTHLQNQDVRTLGVATLGQALEELRGEKSDLMIVDLRLPDGDGLDVMRSVRQLGLDTRVIMMTGHGTMEKAIEAMRLGAADFLIKPFDFTQFDCAINESPKNRKLSISSPPLNQSSTVQSAADILNQSPDMKAVADLIRRIAVTTTTVLIQGESGTGKELVAQAIHEQSARHDCPYIKLNCAAVPANLLESELFGHEKGAFTGATARREGRFEQSDGGTLLLDEVTEMPIVLQARLLRVIQEHEIERVGGNETIPVDVRIIASTNRDLAKAVERGEFREDLYFRLNVVNLKIPPLRERQNGVEYHLRKFLQEFALQCNKPVPRVAPLAMEQLLRYHWPGNIRELHNIVERAVVTAEEGRDLEISDFALAAPAAHASLFYRQNPFPTVAEMEKRLIDLALKKTCGQRNRAAELLGLHVRTLRNKLHQYANEGEPLPEELETAPPS
jgi:DNA-binding NtrC family response regulator